MEVFIGNDWAEGHHDVVVMDQTGQQLAYARLPEGIGGIARFHEMIADTGVEDPAGVSIGIETDRGLWVEALVAAGYRVHAVNPMAASRYRDRHRVSGAKSDARDALMLADLVRTDRHLHPPVVPDSSEASAIKVLTRSHQTLIWERSRQTSRLRHLLREFYPAALEAFKDLASRDCLAMLTKAPTPEQGAALRVTQIKAVLGKAGRSRYLDTTSEQIQIALRSDQLHTSPVVAAAMGSSVTAIVEVVKTLQVQIANLETEMVSHFDEHPDAAIYRSLPGLGDVLSARVLGEFGDAPNRYDSAKSRRNYAGTSPLTVASGKKAVVRFRHVKNRRLYAAIDQWAMCATNTSLGCRSFYDQQRAAGHDHHKALRALGNRLVGYLHGCLRTGIPYSEEQAWAHRQTTQTRQAA